MNVILECYYLADLFRQNQTFQHCHIHYQAKHPESCHDRSVISHWWNAIP